MQVARAVEDFKKLSSERLYGAVEELLSLTEQSNRDGLKPPEIFRDPVEDMCCTVPYLMAVVGDGENRPRNDIGIVHYDPKSTGSSDETLFGFHFDAVPLGLTKHKLESRTHGTLDVQLLTLGGRHGNRRRDSWVITVYLGYEARERGIQTEDAFYTDRPNRVWPYEVGGSNPKHDYGEVTNTVLALRGRGVFSGQIGTTYDMAGYVDPTDKPKMYTKEFAFENSRYYTRRVYDWMQWRTLRAAVTDPDETVVLYQLGSTYGIGDVFPEVIGDAAEAPKLGALRTDEILRVDDTGAFAGEELSWDELTRIPRYFFGRIAEIASEPLVIMD